MYIPKKKNHTNITSLSENKENTSKMRKKPLSDHKLMIDKSNLKTE